MKPREAHKLLIEKGYYVARDGKGGHRIYMREGTPGFITLFWHNHGKDMTQQSCATLKVLLKKIA